MGTAAVVAHAQPDGRVRSIVVNYDGYPNYLMPILNSHMTDDRIISNVLDRGDASGIYIEDGELRADHYIDRGEKIATNKAMEFGSVREFIDEMSDENPYNADYYYLFADGKWNVTDRYGLSRGF